MFTLIQIAYEVLIINVLCKHVGQCEAQRTNSVEHQERWIEMRWRWLSPVWNIVYGDQELTWAHTALSLFVVVCVYICDWPDHIGTWVMAFDIHPAATFSKACLIGRAGFEKKNGMSQYHFSLQHLIEIFSAHIHYQFYESPAGLLD